MKKILLVDDDSLVLRMYQAVLSREGMEVDTACDGLSAIQALKARRPDILVLDLMMPKFTGVDVLRFVRSQPDLASLPVVVLSNSYMEDLARGVAAMGVQRALLKARCTPSMLTRTIDEVLQGKVDPDEITEFLTAKATPKPALDAAQAPIPDPPAQTPSHPSHHVLPSFSPLDQGDLERRTKAREHFSASATANCAELQKLFTALEAAGPGQPRQLAVQNLYRKVHFITAVAGLADFYRVGQMASVFEALLFYLMDNPIRVSPSVMRTVSTTLAFLQELLKHTDAAHPEAPPQDRALVVDDDRLSNRLVVSALREARIPARSTEDPLTALRWLQESYYNLILLDIVMPSLNGFELCQELRALPGYEKTPVIYITSHTEFETYARSQLSGGDDLISKPVLPMEVACKAVMYLLRGQLVG
jgi:CheY-like chemotaxis protein